MQLQLKILKNVILSLINSFNRYVKYQLLLNAKQFFLYFVDVYCRFKSQEISKYENYLQMVLVFITLECFGRTETWLKTCFPMGISKSLSVQLPQLGVSIFLLMLLLLRQELTFLCTRICVCVKTNLWIDLFTKIL